MRRRIVLLLKVVPDVGSTGGLIEISDVESLRSVPIDRGAFLVTLDVEPDVEFSRGFIRSLDDPEGARFAIQSSRELLDVLSAYLDNAIGST